LQRYLQRIRKEERELVFSSEPPVFREEDRELFYG
jgi:hypothetical protein